MEDSVVEREQEPAGGAKATRKEDRSAVRLRGVTLVAWWLIVMGLPGCAAAVLFVLVAAAARSFPLVAVSAAVFLGCGLVLWTGLGLRLRIELARKIAVGILGCAILSSAYWLGAILLGAGLRSEVLEFFTLEGVRGKMIAIHSVLLGAYVLAFWYLLLPSVRAGFRRGA